MHILGTGLPNDNEKRSEFLYRYLKILIYKPQTLWTPITKDNKTPQDK